MKFPSKWIMMEKTYVKWAPGARNAVLATSSWNHNILPVYNRLSLSELHPNFDTSFVGHWLHAHIAMWQLFCLVTKFQFKFSLIKAYLSLNSMDLIQAKLYTVNITEASLLCCDNKKHVWALYHFMHGCRQENKVWCQEPFTPKHTDSQSYQGAISQRVYELIIQIL